MSPALESHRRPLTEAERRLLRAKIRELRGRGRAGPRILVPGLSVIGGLWLVTLVVSDAPWPVITLFWWVAGAGILLWVRHDLGREIVQLDDVRRGYESALRRGEVEVFDVRADAFVEFEEVEDEGACYAFAIADNQLVFVSGQQFYPEAKFPSLDFSVVHFVDEHGEAVDAVIEKRGPRTAPLHTIPAETKLRLEIPEHLEIVEGRPEDVVGALAPSR